MKFRIITDIHFGQNGYCLDRLRRLGTLAVPIVKDFVALTNQDKDTEFVLQLGDLIEDETAEADVQNLTEMLAMFAQIKCPVHHVIGNHDTKKIDAEKYLSIMKQKSASYTIQSEHLTFLVLETCLIGDIPLLTVEASKLLNSTLKDSQKNVVIISHHPFADHDLTENLGWYPGNLHRAMVGNRQEVRKIFADSEKVVCCINGHLHANYTVIHDGIPYVTIQSATDNFRSDGTPALANAELTVTEGGIQLIVNGNDPVQGFIPFPTRLPTI